MAVHERTLARAAAMAVGLVLLPCAATADEGRGVIHRIVTYAPSRVLDVLDVARARVRVGPGAAISLRATEAADLFAGAYGTLYAGLPGPRGRRLPRLPLGIEARSGVEVSAADASTGAGFAPDYGVGEIGLGFQAALVGLDVGIDPFEIVDLVAGLFFLDPAGDDV